MPVDRLHQKVATLLATARRYPAVEVQIAIAGVAYAFSMRGIGTVEVAWPHNGRVYFVIQCRALQTASSRDIDVYGSPFESEQSTRTCSHALPLILRVLRAHRRDVSPQR